ncbi:hypothetical protein D9611_006299 [Ephemerocybe angulata]|uniref:Uncharacterized protein n=1 Tax=Ephemerocybe angulata TaxID=980116 RepID=A0A8H5C720_9AGAR|nr:hypothetical protein D9611_006299 [Tulosesus angulatus]
MAQQAHAASIPKAAHLSSKPPSLTTAPVPTALRPLKQVSFGVPASPQAPTNTQSPFAPAFNHHPAQPSPFTPAPLPHDAQR